MDKKYSPAPWHETESDDGDFLVVMDKAHSVVIGNLEGSCSTCHANSRLISAAPELLEALQAFATISCKETWKDHEDLVVEVNVGDIRRARAAIKKATNYTV